MSEDCIFCKIAAKEIPSSIVYEDELVMAFSDISPAAPVHVLVIPKKHIANLLEAQPEDMSIISHMLDVVQKLAVTLNIQEKGFRLVVNTKEDGGQTVPHLHMHILGGRFMEWPPG